MKPLFLFLLLAASLLLVEILHPILSAPRDENGLPVLFDDEDEFCALPGRYADGDA